MEIIKSARGYGKVAALHVALSIAVAEDESSVSIEALNRSYSEFGRTAPVSGDHLPQLIVSLAVPVANTNQTATARYPDRTTPEARAHEYANKLIAKRRAMTHNAFNYGKLGPWSNA